MAIGALAGQAHDGGALGATFFLCLSVLNHAELSGRELQQAPVWAERSSLGKRQSLVCLCVHGCVHMDRAKMRITLSGRAQCACVHIAVCVWTALRCISHQMIFYCQNFCI